MPEIQELSNKDFAKSWLSDSSIEKFPLAKAQVKLLINTIENDWSGRQPEFLLKYIQNALLENKTQFVKNETQFDDQDLENIGNEVIQFLRNDNSFNEEVRCHFNSLNTSPQSLYKKHPILLHFLPPLIDPQKLAEINNPSEESSPNKIDINPPLNPIFRGILTVSPRIVGSLILVVLLSIGVVVWVVEANRKLFPMPDRLRVVSGAKIKLAGSIAMLRLNNSFKEGFEKKFPSTTIDLTAYQGKNNRGSDHGIELLCQGKVDIGAISRSLDKDEQCPDGKKLFAVKVGEDSLSVYVHRDNPVNNLSKSQVKKIFQCKISQWIDIGHTWTNKNPEIEVLNRPVHTGGFRYFKEKFLDNEDFCPQGSPNYSNMKQLDDDEITQINKNFTINQISYAAYGLADFSGIKRLSIDNVKPEDENYPYRRPLFYVYKADSAKNPLLPVKQFLGFVLNFDQSTK
jgi:phosphate transport system substrate-binding protein